LRARAAGCVVPVARSVRPNPGPRPRGLAARARFCPTGSRSPSTVPEAPVRACDRPAGARSGRLPRPLVARVRSCRSPSGQQMSLPGPRKQRLLPARCRPHHAQALRSGPGRGLVPCRARVRGRRSPSGQLMSPPGLRKQHRVPSRRPRCRQAGLTARRLSIGGLCQRGRAQSGSGGSAHPRGIALVRALPRRRDGNSRLRGEAPRQPRVVISAERASRRDAGKPRATRGGRAGGSAAVPAARSTGRAPSAMSPRPRSFREEPRVALLPR
jgi:hypothetical protein